MNILKAFSVSRIPSRRDSSPVKAFHRIHIIYFIFIYYILSFFFFQCSVYTTSPIWVYSCFTKSQKGLRVTITNSWQIIVLSNNFPRFLLQYQWSMTKEKPRLPSKNLIEINGAQKLGKDLSSLSSCGPMTNAQRWKITSDCNYL